MSTSFKSIRYFIAVAESGSISAAIQELGVEVIHIPGGCTGLLQPLDVGVNKPFKVKKPNASKLAMP